MTKSIYEAISIVLDKSVMQDCTNYLIQFVVSVDGRTLAARRGDHPDVITMDILEKRISDLRNEFVNFLAKRGNNEQSI